MLKEHRELLGLIKSAEEWALELYHKGEAVEEVVTGLRDAGKKVANRIQAYEGMREKSEGRNPKAEPKGKAAEKTGAVPVAEADLDGS